MIANFFRSLEDHKVDYLLISGQATVLYGAAASPEDVDLWINPTPRDRAAFAGALAARQARYYKLTPPFTLEFLGRGHGFHFLLPKDQQLFVDVMGAPPRVPAFREAKRSSNLMRTPWGIIPTLGVWQLVEIKTQRWGDYPIIGQLVLRRLETLHKPAAADYCWAIANTFSVPELRELVAHYPGVARVCRRNPSLRDFAEQVAGAGEADANAEEAAERFLADRALACQREDRRYWRPIIAELRELKRRGELMPEGSAVRA